MLCVHPPMRARVMLLVTTADVSDGAICTSIFIELPLRQKCIKPQQPVRQGLVQVMDVYKTEADMGKGWYAGSGCSEPTGNDSPCGSRACA